MSNKGDSVGEAQAWVRQQVKQLEAVARLDGLLDTSDERGVSIEGISVRCPNYEREGWLLVIRARTDEGAVVAFHDAPTFLEACVGLSNRIRNNSLKWREDEYR